jgi:6-phosphogluconolactonase
MAGDRMSAAAPSLRVFDTPEALAQQLADWIVARIAARPGRAALCLSGGATPRPLYELLGAAPRRDRLPWARLHCFWGDERFVPHSHPNSNFRMAHEALLQHVAIPAENIHAVPIARRSAAAAAADYEHMLKRFHGAETLAADQPLFDLTLLGLGEDGHIASLFPQGPALAEAERWAVAVTGHGALDRITLTYPALASSAATVVLVTGERKREVVARLFAGDPALPATHLRPRGEFFCFADRAAAAAAPAPAPAFNGD